MTLRSLGALLCPPPRCNRRCNSARAAGDVKDRLPLCNSARTAGGVNLTLRIGRALRGGVCGWRQQCSSVGVLPILPRCTLARSARMDIGSPRYTLYTPGVSNGEGGSRCSARVGMGATYTRTTQGEVLRLLERQRRDELMAEYYWPHHRELDRLAVHTARPVRYDIRTRCVAYREGCLQAMQLETYGRCLLLDCHSFPTGPLPTQQASPDGPMPQGD